MIERIRDDKDLRALATMEESAAWQKGVRPWLLRSLETTESQLRSEEDPVRVRWRQAEARELRELIDMVDHARDELKARTAAASGVEAFGVF